MALPSSADRPAATAIVCTCGMSSTFGAALASLARQTLARERFEIVVVNNRPEDATLSAEVAASVDTHLGGVNERVRLVNCHTPGHSHAKNAAIAAARGDVLCFLDDDAIAREDWLEAAVKSFASHSNAGVVGGRIVLVPPQPTPRALRAGWESYWSQFLPPGGYTIANEATGYPFGANWCARREALVAVGGFPRCFGRTGNDFAGGEELVAAHLVSQLGYDVAVDSTLEVEHHVEASRYTFRHIRRTVLAGVMAQYRAQRAGIHLPASLTLLNSITRLLMLHTLKRRKPKPMTTSGTTIRKQEFPHPSLWDRLRHIAIWREAYLRRIWAQIRETCFTFHPTTTARERQN